MLVSLVFYSVLISGGSSIQMFGLRSHIHSITAMDAATAVSELVEQQHAFNTLAVTLMLTSYLFPKSTKLKDGDEFDFLIVGGGTAGCVIANRLVKANFSVLLLEAGDDLPYESFLPGTLAHVAKSRIDWNYTAVPDNFTRNCHRKDRIELPTGKVLGGSSGINFMITARGNDRDYHRWAAAANDSSWEFNNLIHYFIRNERLLAPKITNSPLGKCRGVGGTPPDTGDGGTGKIGISVDNATNIPFYLDAFEEMGNKIVLDLNGKCSTGYARPLYSIAEGYRQSTAYDYLVPAFTQDSESNPKLFVTKNTLVTKIVFDINKNAIGVLAVINNKIPIFLKARKEVIVSAGAIKTPQLLMLSGIGPRRHLEAKFIKVISDLPVGENFQDNVAVTILHKTRKITPPSSVNYHDYPSATVVGFKSLHLSGKYPDYGTISFIEGIPHYLLDYCAQVFDFKYELCNIMYETDLNREIFYTHIFGLNPKSRGKVSLKTTNPKDAPIVETGHYSHKDDLEDTIKYIKDFLPIQNTTFFKNSGAWIVDPIQDVCDQEYGSDDYWRCYAYCMSSTKWNYCGTCSFGAVVDSRLKVFGVQRLRVVDASVIPNPVAGGNYMATVVLADKACDMIKEDWKKQ